MRLPSLLAIGLLTACVPSPGADVSMNQTKSSTSTSAAPAAMNSFGMAAAARPTRSNAEIARDFLELTFTMESGRPLPVMTRFEGPVTVRTSGPVPASASTDLARLLQRFRNEAGINIREVSGSSPASINIEFVPRAAIKATYANVACFVVPRVASWAEFRSGRNNGTLDWTTLRQRDRVSVFIPADSSAQEVRDCLHEETAQAMGPLNDLFRLTDSVFNDDNFHTSLTGFDMTVLRAYYAPEMRSGMTQAEVAAKLPGVLARINPAGNRPGSSEATPTPRFWINSIQMALGTSGNAARREAAARQAIATARAQGWVAGRLAFSHFALGRITLARDPATAIQAFNEAGRIYRGLPGGQIYAAHVDMQLAAYALSQGQAENALQIADRNMPIVAAAENAALMATMMLVKAEALELLGREREAAAVRIDSQGWARYGFGSEAQIRARASEISALARRGNKS